MKKFDEISKFEVPLLLINWGICLTVGIILTIFRADMTFNYVLGSLTSYVTFTLHSKYVRDYGDQKVNNTMKLFTNPFVRLIFAGAMMGFVYFFSGQDFWSLIVALIGFSVLYFTLVVYGIIYFAITKNKKGEIS